MLRALVLLSLSSAYVVTGYDSNEVSSTLIRTLEPGVWHVIDAKNEDMLIELLNALENSGLHTSGIIPQIFQRRQFGVLTEYAAIYYDSKNEVFCSLVWRSKLFNYNVDEPVCSSK
ncbi:hypothetical protein GE061_012589 [Apolygus lucorum]|uniref:Uncharacterized protein n=1 Tax=Apolygus lucorum TaxID=248454 RepID=A0A6A4K001_APOLU|nr:hypothetical protein GE061_012589 [Apolygus lucorum]